MADSRIDELRRRLERDPASRLFAQLAEEHRKAGEHGEAIRVARAGLALHPAYPSARLTLGRALLDSGDAGGARAELETALRDAPDNILASRFLGLALEALGEHGPALLQLQKTLKMAPGDRQLEAQVAALQARLKGAGAAPPPRPAAEPSPGAAPAAPGTAAVGDQGEDLPATILIYKRDDHAAGGRRPRAPLAAPAPSAPAAAPVPSTPAGETAATTLPAGALSVEETVFEHEGAPEPASAGPAASASARAWAEDAAAGGPAPATVEEAPPFSSSTLAELYFRQGLVERAVETYRQLLVQEPGNDRARSRLAEIEAAIPTDPRAARRRALERTIAGLEALLGAVRARRA
ncbi:MAG TPA: tetratricopeptide repeat protein [Vicinamibacteria bacterium]